MAPLPEPKFDKESRLTLSDQAWYYLELVVKKAKADPSASAVATNNAIVALVPRIPGTSSLKTVHILLRMRTMTYDYDGPEVTSGRRAPSCARA